MTTRALFSISLAIWQLGWELLLQPYQTMQSLVQERVFVWMTLVPTAVLAVVTVGWKGLVVPTVQLFFSCQSSGPFFCDWLSFIATWVTLFFLYWQLLLCYLLFRFKWAWSA